MVSAYILFLNPLILSGASAGANTGMPSNSVVAATAISTGVATAFMGFVGNYPWVVSVQLGTNTYFVLNLIKPFEPCGYHSFLQGNDSTTANTPCTCTKQPDGSFLVDQIGTAADPGPLYGTTNSCIGSAIPYEKALAATFLEGIVFLIICFTGMRSRLIKIFPRTVLMAGACGIGVFIAFVGVKDMGIIVSAPYPTLLKLASSVPYAPGGWGSTTYTSGVGFNACVIYLAGPPYSVVCNWLSIGGLIFTGILVLWNCNGALIIGILFVLFIGWIKFPHHLDNGGLVPNKGVAAPTLAGTAGSLSFHWKPNFGTIFGGFITFLYLDFIGSCITFVSMGTMCGIVNVDGDIPKSNRAFIADGAGSTLGGLLGSSALTTYVESAAAVREGGRTGLTAVVCSCFFFASMFLAPIFSTIPNIATGPILTIIGILIFMESILEINWLDLTEAAPAFMTIIGMPFTSNIAYGFIGGFITWFVTKFFTYQMHPLQQKWPGYALYKRMSAPKSMQIHIPGWTDNPEICPPKVASKFPQTFISGGIGVGGLGHIAAKLPDTESEASLEEATKDVAPAVHLDRDDSAHPQ
jgi:AGZA family xanthine/uracil permease-like MFS transporter